MDPHFDSIARQYHDIVKVSSFISYVGLVSSNIRFQNCIFLLMFTKENINYQSIRGFVIVFVFEDNAENNIYFQTVSIQVAIFFSV